MLSLLRLDTKIPRTAGLLTKTAKLICESSQGHVFEVNRVGELEWEFWNPVMKEGKRKTIYRFMRVPEEHVRSLIARASIKRPRN